MRDRTRARRTRRDRQQLESEAAFTSWDPSGSGAILVTEGIMNRRVVWVGVVAGVVGVAAGCGGKTREDASRAGTGGSTGHGDVENESGTEGG
jgi:hypothetical protein